MAPSKNKRGAPLAHAVQAYADREDLAELRRIQEQIEENRQLVGRRVAQDVQPLSSLHSELSPEELLKAIEDTARNQHYAVAGRLFIQRDRIMSKLHAELTRKLWAGELYATGFTPPINEISKPEKIPAHLWNVLRIDYPASSASHDGALFEGIEVFTARQSDGPEPDRTAKTLVTMKALESWYRSYVSEYEARSERPSREDDWEAAKQHFEGRVRRDDVRDMRRRLAPKDWHNTGPKKPGT